MVGCERGHVHGASSGRDAHEVGLKVKGDTEAAGDKTDENRCTASLASVGMVDSLLLSLALQSTV